MRFQKPPHPAYPDPRDDPSVVEWEDGSVWQVSDDGRWTRLQGPRQENPAPASRGRRSSTDVDWGMIVYGVLILLALWGAVNLAVGLWNHAVYCHLGTTQGCYFYIPPHAAAQPAPQATETP